MRNSRITLPIALSIVLALTSAKTALCSITVPWSASAVTNTGFSTDFDVATITFTGFTADSLDAIATDFGNYHNHGSSGHTFTLDLRLDGVWTNIWSETPPGSFSNFLVSSIVGSPISFASSVVDGLRLSVNPIVGQGFHSIYAPGQYGNTGTSFEFSDNGTGAVPEPTMFMVWTGLACCCGLAAKLRRRAA